LSEGDVRLPKLFRQTVSQCWPDGGKTAVTKHVFTHTVSLKKPSEYQDVISTDVRTNQPQDQTNHWTHYRVGI